MSRWPCHCVALGVSSCRRLLIYASGFFIQSGFLLPRQRIKANSPKKHRRSMLKGADAAPRGPTEVMSLPGWRVECTGHVPSKPHSSTWSHISTMSHSNCWVTPLTLPFSFSLTTFYRSRLPLKTFHTFRSTFPPDVQQEHCSPLLISHQHWVYSVQRSEEYAWCKKRKEKKKRTFG